MPRVHLAMGSNLGDRRAHLERARAALGALPATRVTRMSPVYETAPVGPQEQGPFLNAAIEIDTELTPRLLLAHTQRIEQAAGRAEPAERQAWGPRELDLDLLLFADRVLSQPGLAVPHPHLHQRWFVLKPLAELIPDRVPPGYTDTIQQMLEALESEQQRTADAEQPQMNTDEHG